MKKKLIHKKVIEIRWGDMDAYGHVNNINYFLYAQEARFDMLEQKKLEYDPNKVAPVLAETNCKFIRPINFPETILIETWFNDIIGEKKLIFEHAIKSNYNDQIYAVLTATNVWYDFSQKKAVLVPENIIQALLSG
jgi:acyl-CoA thioester hydrolase